jgi:hypothetical protein
MKKLYYIGFSLFAVFEIAKTYFIMPMPGSQQINAIEVAYFLHSYRWIFRIAFVLLAVVGARAAFSNGKKWHAAAFLIATAVVVYLFSFKFTAEGMFQPPTKPVFNTRQTNNLNDSTLIIAVLLKGEARAYPVRYLQYHHQVRDSVGGQPIMVTYCSVCRTGRVYQPIVNGKIDDFRLVGMDHYNALFEDSRTKSWWRQSTGQAVTGKLKGTQLPEVECVQFTLGKFFFLYPFGKVMQAEAVSVKHYDTLGLFEKGKSKSRLLFTDTLSWRDKSWIVGIKANGKSKAYDWNDLKTMRIINDTLGNTPVVLALSDDGQSFAAFLRNSANEVFFLRNDSLITTNTQYDFAGRSRAGLALKPVAAYQEFWHSWKTFNPGTQLYRR